MEKISKCQKCDNPRDQGRLCNPCRENLGKTRKDKARTHAAARRERSIANPEHHASILAARRLAKAAQVEEARQRARELGETKTCIGCNTNKLVDRFTGNEKTCVACRSKARYESIKADPAKKAKYLEACRKRDQKMAMQIKSDPERLAEHRRRASEEDKARRRRMKEDPILWAEYLRKASGRLRASRARRKDKVRAQRLSYWHNRSEEKRADRSRKKAEYDKVRRLCPEVIERRRATNQARARRIYTRGSIHLLTRQLRTLTRETFRRHRLPKTGKTLAILGAESWEQILAFLGPRPEGPDIQLDHICPLAQARDAEELHKLFHYTNLQWLSRADNIKKGTQKTPEGEILCLKLLGRPWI